MATFDLPALPEPRVSTQFLVGAASPLWGYYGAAAAGGMTYWLMTRWTQVANLEALFGAVAKAPEAVAEPAETMVEAVTPMVGLATVDAAPEPVGGEAAPITALVEALIPEPEPEAAPVVEAIVEPVVEAAPEPTPEPEATPEEPPFVAAASLDAEPPPEPVAVVEPLPKPRVRKAPPAADAQA
ncbi:MAG: hypothetical protein AB1942_02890 [Pseudomonadota bacterium]